MSFKNVPIPAAAEAAGFTKLEFADDFDSYDTIDLSGEGKPGYLWYTDRPYGMTTLTKDELQIKDSVLFMKPLVCPAAIGMPTYSTKGKTGYVMRYGYAEARIRANEPEGEYNGVPAFWGIGLRDMLKTDAVGWKDCGELDILEIERCDDPETGKRRNYYTGTLHHHHRTGELKENGAPVQQTGTNFINALGYKERRWLDNEWHTYAALWEPGHVSWYLDGKLMHSARYSEDALPEYYYRDDPTPLPRYEHAHPEAAGRTWVGAHSVMDGEEEVIILGCNNNWPMEVDWVRIWGK